MNTLAKPSLSITLSLLLVAAIPLQSATQQSGPAAPATSTQPAPLSTTELQQLVAPIALYPDALVAQVLGAATFPDQVAFANDWLQQNRSLAGTSLTQAVDQEPWEPSIKALTQFPSVLSNMAKNISWTSSLGEAYHNQSADVMTAIQTLRAQAKAAGKLQSGLQMTVVQQSPQTIVIQPTDPQVIYVPQYNPSTVYGTPYTTPGYSAGSVAATGLLAFGAGIAIGAAMNNSWGYSYWNCNWHGGAVVYGGSAYYGNNAWHGGAYGSSASVYGPYGAAHAGTAYNPSTGTYARGASASGAYGSAAVGQAYNPNTGVYAATHQSANAYGNYGRSVAVRDGETAYTQHQTTSQGSVGTVQTSSGGRGVAGTGQSGSFAAGQTASGNKYATANGNAYKNTGSGWEKDTNGSWNSVQKPSTSSSAGWEQARSEHSSAWGGAGSGWQSRAESARGSESRSGGGLGGYRGRR